MRIRYTLCTSTLILALVSITPALTDTTFTYTSIDFPGAIATVAGGINNIGQIVGVYLNPDFTAHGFVFTPTTGFATLDDPNATSGSESIGISNSGQIVGTYNLLPPREGDNFEGAHGFLFNGSTFTAIDFPGANDTTPHKINDPGEIVGVYRLADGLAHGFTYIQGTLATLDFPGAYSTQANGINNVGNIVGRYRAFGGAPKQGFLYNGSTFSTLDFPGAVQTVAADINNSGDIAGLYTSATGPFGIAGSSGFLDRKGSFSSVTFPNSIGTEAYGINDNGQIVGVYQDQTGMVHGFLATFNPSGN
jgi:uncharacterized membrane protein